MVNTTWEGRQFQGWRDADLAALQQAWQELALTVILDATFAMEEAQLVDRWEQLSSKKYDKCSATIALERHRLQHGSDPALGEHTDARLAGSSLGPAGGDARRTIAGGAPAPLRRQLGAFPLCVGGGFLVNFRA
jgi:hypothetical protein